MHLQGFRAKVKIGSRALAVARFSVSDEVADLDVSNTEGYQGWAGEGGLAPGEIPIVGGNMFSNSTYGQAKATIELEQATLIQAGLGNPFLVPFSIYSGMWVKLEIFPNRALVFRHLFPRALITKTSHTGQVTALQPLTLTLITDGKFLLYTSVAAIASGETTRPGVV